ncbi:signal recognition particle protein [Rhabdochlamydiaceae symbiont of Dictyostelium giganteum]|uniref:signal recognition particle protein n=1 Tax=Rhabdochlamydiaceae symbiont of Dictyostelium giganteum TaxID=3342349 RepID=UPI00384BA932
MLGTLTEKLRALTSRLSAQKSLTEDNIAEAVREVRLALLDADVNFTVVSQFIKRVKEKSVGDRVFKSVSPGQQFIEIVHEELVQLMGSDDATLHLEKKPSVIMLCGLQGSGKTTTSAKLAHLLQKKPYEKKVLVAACDLARLAAVEQLKTLCASINTPLFALEGCTSPVQVAKEALDKAVREGFDVLIVDTAGRLHIDEELMQQLVEIKRAVNPTEILFVASAHAGQDAISTAKAFDEKMAITGTILTMLDGSSRSGSAISIREVTQKPLKFEGIGEKIGDLQPFSPKSMADRILGMGDIVNLVRKAKEAFQDNEEKELEKKILKATFTYADYLKQMSKIKQMGSFKSLLQMIPGMPQIPKLDQSEKEFNQIEAIILSMTPQERNGRVELIPSRRWRIAKGSGTSVDSVNRLIKGFKKMKDLMKNLPKNPLQNPSSLKKFSDFLG